jgi:hypothetical protein
MSVLTHGGFQDRYLKLLGHPFKPPRIAGERDGALGRAMTSSVQLNAM